MFSGKHSLRLWFSRDYVQKWPAFEMAILARKTFGQPWGITQHCTLPCREKVLDWPPAGELVVGWGVRTREVLLLALPVVTRVNHATWCLMLSQPVKGRCWPGSKLFSHCCPGRTFYHDRNVLYLCCPMWWLLAKWDLSSWNVASVTKELKMFILLKVATCG